MTRTIHTLITAVAIAATGCATEESIGDLGSEAAGEAAGEVAGHATHDPSLASHAAPHTHDQARDPASRAAALQSQLGLSAEQTARVEAAMREHDQPADRIAAVREILDPQQRTAFDDRVREHHEALLARMNRLDPAAHAARLQGRLGLDDQQTARLEEVFRTQPTHEELAEAFSAILTPEQHRALHHDAAHGPHDAAHGPHGD